MEVDAVVGRRGVRLLAPVVAMIVLAAACGSSDTTAEQRGEGGSGKFPVSIEHSYGETTIETEPERVVTVGLTDQDALLALGVVPVGVTEWFGEQPSATWPWAQDELGDAEPTVLDATDSIDFESIAALRPDLILAVYSGLTESDYGTLSGIAPTVAQPDDHVDFGVPWQEQTRIVGTAVGKQDEADRLVDEVESQVESTIAAHPEFDGASGLVASPMSASKVALFSPEDSRGRFMESLGFELPPEVEEIAGDNFSADVGLERIDLVDVDALVMLLAAVDANLPELEDESLYTNLAVHEEGRAVYLGLYEPLGAAMSFVSVLSLPFLLDELVPQLSAAVDGDPTTT